MTMTRCFYVNLLTRPNKTLAVCQQNDGDDFLKAITASKQGITEQQQEAPGDHASKEANSERGIEEMLQKLSLGVIFVNINGKVSEFFSSPTTGRAVRLGQLEGSRIGQLTQPKKCVMSHIHGVIAIGSEVL